MLNAKVSAKLHRNIFRVFTAAASKGNTGNNSKNSNCAHFEILSQRNKGLGEG